MDGVRQRFIHVHFGELAEGTSIEAVVCPVTRVWVSHVYTDESASGTVKVDLCI